MVKRPLLGIAGVLMSTILSCRAGEIAGHGDMQAGHEIAPAPVDTPQLHEPTAAPPAVEPEPRPAEAPSATDVPDWGWGDSIKWHDFSEARSIAQRDGRPIFLLVYAKWCGQCRALAPVFAKPEIARLAKHFVMARQDHDERPEWLDAVAPDTGTYVPRIFFFGSDGTLHREITSGSDRFPYFYPPKQPRVLLASLNRALGKD